ncbi:restriction endonuclease [Streptomyces sp. CA-111067]|uniref:restriction endonuclease n=1 Tax=Streptomyces sp. CA-111067 TaxID=3240046 RepID=UPI003D98C997
MVSGAAIGVIVLVSLLAAHPVLGVLMILGLLGAVVATVVRSVRRRTEARAVWAARAQHVEAYQNMSPKEFEHALAFLCQRDGCRDVRVVGGSGDLGADVIATVPDGRRLVLQAKRYGPNSTVGSGDVQKVNGTYQHAHGGHLAAIVTTSRFTRPARDYAVRVGIRLFDADALAGWTSRTGPAPWH